MFELSITLCKAQTAADVINSVGPSLQVTLLVCHLIRFLKKTSIMAALDVKTFQELQIISKTHVWIAEFSCSLILVLASAPKIDQALIDNALYLICFRGTTIVTTPLLTLYSFIVYILLLCATFQTYVVIQIQMDI